MADETPPKPEVTSGSPVVSLSDDRLGRRQFALNLAAVISKYKSPKSVTFGLYGPWGSGKSSLLNFLATELDRDETLIVARFNPWNFADQHKLLRAFLRSFATVLGRGDKSAKLKEAAKYVDALASATDMVKPLSAIAKLIGKILGDKAAKMDEVEAIKDHVSALLRENKQKIVVLIDDLDRLTQDEIRQMFQLVKAGADFDNVIYVMAFDRTIVAPALDAVSNNDGERYLEKVINVPLSLPAMTERQSREILFEELNAYAARHQGYEWENNGRLQEILDILPIQFKTIRLINILMNDLVVAEPLVENDVDFTDHIAITMLKVLEPKVFDFLAENPRLFVDIMRDQFIAEADADKNDKQRIDEVLSRGLRVLTVKECVAVLSTIFPKVKRVYENTGKEWGKREWVRQKRACADVETFNRYFRFRVDEADLSTADLAKLQRAVQEPGELRSLLLEATDPDKLSRILKSIGDMAGDRLSTAATQNLVSTLMDVSGKFPSRVGLDNMLFGATNETIRVVRNLLVSLPDRSTRARVVLNGIESNPHGVEMTVSLVETLTASQVEKSKLDSTFDDGDIPEIRLAAANLVKGKVEDFSIFEDPENVRSVYAWILRLAPEAAVADVQRLTLTNDDAFLKILSLFTNVTIESSHTPVPMDLKTLRRMFADDDIERRLKAIANEDPSLRGEAERLLALFEKAKSREVSNYDEDDETS